MSDKELIKQEIERRIKNLEFSLENNCVEKYSKLDILGNISTLKSLLRFIDSLPEESNIKNEDSSDECPCCGWALDSDGCCSSCGYGRR